jgi:hypothetical protein
VAAVSLRSRLWCAALAATLQLAMLSAPSAQTRVPPGHDEERQRERRRVLESGIYLVCAVSAGERVVQKLVLAR